ncbi:hypothetical protein HanRHA438_Chr13g0629571 [Helianthus annuus]|nr:hypothetical protein HanRHA438_Chr13g0629571 [Helianthus annuus]
MSWRRRFISSKSSFNSRLEDDSTFFPGSLILSSTGRSGQLFFKFLVNVHHLI